MALKLVLVARRLSTVEELGREQIYLLQTGDCRAGQHREKSITISGIGEDVLRSSALSTVKERNRERD